MWECRNARCGKRLPTGRRAMGFFIDIAVFSCMSAFVTGIVLIAARFLI
jgi:hypothetical protein